MRVAARIAPESTASWFSGCSHLVKADLAKLDVSRTTSMEGMFKGCTSLVSLDLSEWDTSNVTDASYLFAGCSSLKKLNVKGWNTERVRSANNMFDGCRALDKLDLTGFKTPKLVSACCMFRRCSSLSSLDASTIRVSKVSDLSSVFERCSSLVSLDISSWNTSRAQDMEDMFAGCSKLRSLALGKRFTFNGATGKRMTSLPAKTWWMSSADGTAYAHNALPNNIRATYTRVAKPSVVITKSDTSKLKNLARKKADKLELGDKVVATVGGKKRKFEVVVDPATGERALERTEKVGKVKVRVGVTKTGKLYLLAPVNREQLTAKNVSDTVSKLAGVGTSDPRWERGMAVGKNVRGISKGAYVGVPLKNLIVRSKRLVSKRCKGCLKGSKVKKVIVSVGADRANRKYAKRYKKKVFSKRVCGKKVKFKAGTRAAA